MSTILQESPQLWGINVSIHGIMKCAKRSAAKCLKSCWTQALLVPIAMAILQLVVVRFAVREALAILPGAAATISLHNLTRSEIFSIKMAGSPIYRLLPSLYEYVCTCGAAP